MILLDTTRRLVNTSQDTAPGEMWRGAAASTRPGASGLGPSKKLLKASHSSPRCPSRSSNGGDDQDGATGGGTVRDHGKDTAALRRFNGDLFDWKITEGAKGSGFGVVPRNGAWHQRHRARPHRRP